MQILSFECKNCGALVHVDSGECSYCGTRYKARATDDSIARCVEYGLMSKNEARQFLLQTQTERLYQEAINAMKHYQFT